MRRARTFGYLDAAGRPISDTATVARINALVIPPAWSDVWICTLASGHIQATGVDVAGRRQYRYHDQWRLVRELDKHERVLDFGSVLPRARERINRDLVDGLGRERVLSCAVRLLDLGFFRIGSEQYAARNETFGLATMRKEHVTVGRDGVVRFDYTAKGGKRRVMSLVEPEVGAVVQALKRRRDGSQGLLAYRDGARWVDVKSGDINAHLRGLTAGDYTAKDFRTWSATVLAAVGLAVSTGAETPAARKRAVSRVVQEVAHYLGNTPAVCRASYTNPRIIDLYAAGVTIRSELQLLGEGAAFGQPATQGLLESAVLRMLRAPAGQVAAAS